ncbi:MAG: T9SS type A sorting domain-containing protein [Ignavibacteria bacterium]|nr:T9SS type A sorting domain-containing protein [Ignavibacteria bacterium]
MKKQVFIAAAVVLCSIVIGAVEGLAQQIFNQFGQPELVVGRPYRDLDKCPASNLAKNILPPSAFVLPPTNTNDLDDGYATVNIPSPDVFNYNGQVFSRFYVSVNGFITFDGTKLVPAKQSAGLFINSASYPDNVVAPFWGDHRLRTNANIAAGYMPSEISWAIDVDRDENCDTIKPVRRCIIVQWKNHNINDQTINSSVGNFQARLYLGDQTTNYQGNIEFAYGQVGGNPYTQNTTVVTRGATVGIKGNGGFPGFISDFWNGLIWVPQPGANRRTDSTSTWQPSGGRSDAVIRFVSIVYLTFDQWGFGDADTSAARDNKHDGMPQNRRVTANDARVVMKSIVTKQRLDSVWKRQAYQGDVNHSGRYYYTKLTRDFSSDSIFPPNSGNIVIWRRTIDVEQYFPGQGVIATTGKQVLRVMHESQGLYGVGGKAPDLSSLNQIYYEVTEYDAGLIMRYLSGRLPYLPWVYDNDTTGPDFGKAGDTKLADNVWFGAPVSVGNGLVRVPVYMNGIHNGAFGVRFETNTDIKEISVINSESGYVGADNSDRVAVIIGSGVFGPDSPIAFVTVNENDVYTFGSLRFNEQDRETIRLNGGDYEGAATIMAYPNPMTTEASFALELRESKHITVNVYDIFGKLVNTIFNGEAASGTVPFTWNGADASGILVAPGSYIVRVAGEGVNESLRLTVVR